MKSNKARMATQGKASKQNNMNELYKLFESRSGNTQRDATESAKELANKLVSDLIRRIDEEVIIK